MVLRANLVIIWVSAFVFSPPGFLFRVPLALIKRDRVIFPYLEHRDD